MPTLIADLRFALRSFRSSPGVTAVAVLTLALGIGCATTVFGWVKSILLNPFPGVARPLELSLLETVTTEGQFLRNTSFRDYLDYRDHLAPMAQVAVSRITPAYVGAEDRPERAFAELVSPNFFTTLGVRLIAGSGFPAAACGDQPRTCPYVILSHRFWMSRFNGQTGVIGRTLRVSHREFTIAGIAAPEFLGGMNGLAFDLWVPLAWAEELGTGNGTLNFRGTRDLTSTFVRLKPGITMAEAQAKVTSIASQLAAAHPRTNRGISARLSPLAEGGNGAQQLLSRPLRLLSAVALIVLLIVCANVCNLLLARGISRRREFGVRLALGSGPGRLMRQVLTETFLLAFLGSALGLLLTLWLGDALQLLLPQTDFPIAFTPPLDGWTLSASFFLALAVSFITGAVPAAIAARSRLSEALQEGGRGGAHARTHRLRGLLVVSEVTLATIVLIGAALFVQSFRNALAIDLGFRTERIMTARFFLSAAGYSGAQQREFCLRLRSALEGQPGIIRASYSDSVPLDLGPSPWHQLAIDGYAPAPGEDLHIHRSMVPPGHFDLLHIPLLEGRDFTEADRAGQPGVLIVNQTFVRRYFQNRPPIGRKIQVDGRDHTVVGVVRDSRYHHPAEKPIPYFYIPFAQRFAPGLNFIFFIETRGDPGVAMAAFRRLALELNPDATAYQVMPLAESGGGSLYPQKVAASLLGALAGVALLLAAVGLFSVMSYVVSQRTREVGVRMALGARPADVLRLVLRHGAGMVIPGLLLGIAGSALAGRWAGALLVGVRPGDPATLGLACGVLAAVAAAACLAPAFRAARIDPLTALRRE